MPTEEATTQVGSGGGDGDEIDDLTNYIIQVDIGGHPPFPNGSKQFSDHFGSLLFLAVFWVLNFWSRFEALNDVFWEKGQNHGTNFMK